ncbi:MAG TPA: FHA domain-containing protein, partial [Solirubrobacteraceae bacterium]|nr:FHA domain-containing protein [Solirubrobacteraceae bacterium]
MRDGDRERDLVIDADPRATVAQLSASLAAHANMPDRGVLFSDRLGRLRGDATVAACGLLTGDVVSLTGPVAARSVPSLGSGAPAVMFVVMGGPSAGLRLGLAPGRYVVGRDASADVTVDDASLSRRHFAVEVDAAGRCQVSDLGSSNGTSIEGVGLAAEAAHPVAPGQAVEAGRSTFACGPWQAPDGSSARVVGTRIAFNRQPRVSRGYEPPTLRLDAPPGAARAIRIPLVVAIVPLFMGLALYLLTQSPIMLMMAAFSPLMIIGSSLGDKRSGRREHIQQLAQFKASVARLEAQLSSSRVEEQVERRTASPHAGELTARAIGHLPELWERRPTDRDFLDLRLGVADQPSIVSVAFAPGGDPSLRAGVEETIRAYSTVPVVPVHVRLSEIGAIGIVGEAATAEGLARWILVQLATLQSPRDVVIAAALSPGRADAWRWLTWLPHVDHPASPLDGPHVVAGQGPARELIRSIATIANERREDDHGRKRGRRRTTIAVLVDDDVAPEAAVVDELLDGCADIDVVAVWLAAERRHLPGGCGVIVEASSERAVANVTWTATGRTVPDASADALGLPIAEAIAHSLAAVVDTTAGGAAATLPRSA